MSQESGVLREGARRVWRYQRVLWWLFILNLVLAVFGAMPVGSRIGQVTDHSLHAQRLSERFDLGTFLEMTANPEVSFWSNTGPTLHYVLIYFFFAMFTTGGILEAYRVDRKLTTGEFFRAAGAFFWRWVRLLIFLLIILAPILALASMISKWSGTLSDDAPQEKLGFWVDLLGFLLIVFLMMTVRLWFDLAQVLTVAHDERAVRRSLWKAAKLTFGNFRNLFWVYFRISFLAWLVLGVALWIWTKIPGGRAGLSFFVLEILMLWWIGTRLWQRASETVWYERRASEPVVAVPSAPDPVPPTLESLPAAQ